MVTAPEPRDWWLLWWREGRGNLKQGRRAYTKQRLCSGVYSRGVGAAMGAGRPWVGLSHLAPNRHAIASCSLPFYSTEVPAVGRREGG